MLVLLWNCLVINVKLSRIWKGGEKDFVMVLRIRFFNFINKEGI